MPFDLYIALRYISLAKKGFISLTNSLAVLGIALGVTVLIIVMSVMNGYEKEFMKKILGINGDIIITNNQRKIFDYDKLLLHLQDIKGISSVNPIIKGEALIKKGESWSGVFLKGSKTVIGKEIASSGGLIIGKLMAENINARVGDKVKILAPKFHHTILGAMPYVKTFEIFEIINSGLYDYDSMTVFLNLEDAQRLLDRNYISAIEIRINDSYQTNNIMKNIHKIALEHNLFASDIAAENQDFIQALKVERNTMFMILTMIVIIAAFNIISGLTMLVNEKSKSIAILRALGATKMSIVRIFILIGIILGFIGTFIGAILGTAIVMHINEIKNFFESITNTELFSPVVYFLTYLPSEPRIDEIINVITFTIFISFCATIYPSWKAASVLPADALRYE